jgi:hypothetical protein
MRFTDPTRAALTAAADFIETLSVGESRVGVIGFSGRMQYYLPLRLLEDEYVVAEFREEITAFQYVGFTDIGMALLAAAEMLRDADNLQNPMILLMSDGWIQISPQAIGRTDADSFADVETALDMLEREVPVFTVGLENPQGVDVLLLRMIAERSDAYAQFTNDAEDLPEMFLSILEAHVASIPEQPPEPIPTPTPTPDPTLQPTPDPTPVPTPQPTPDPELPVRELDKYSPDPKELTLKFVEDYEYDEIYDNEDEYEEAPVEEIPTPRNSEILYVMATFTGILATAGVFRFIRAVMK